MKLIGVTGGVGAGKSQVLGYIRDTYKARILLADEAANESEKTGHALLEPVSQTCRTDSAGRWNNNNKKRQRQLCIV